MIPDASNFTVTALPAVEPVSLALAKAHMRVDFDSEDALIALYLQAARRKCEDHCRRAFVAQTVRASIIGDVCCGSTIALPRPQIQTGISLEYLSDASVWTAFPGIVEYLDRQPCEILIVADPPDDLFARESDGRAVWRATYTAGSSDPDTVPAEVKAAILMLASHLFLRREPVENLQTYRVPVGFEDLLAGQVVPWGGAL